MRPFRLHFVNGTERIIEAESHDDAARRGRYVVSSVGWGSDPVGVQDLGEPWSVVDSAEFPEEFE